MKNIKDFLHLYLGCEVQYEGITNGKELGAEQKANKHDIFYIPKIEEVRGLKVGVLKSIEVTVKGFFRKCRIGRKGLQTHYSGDRFKLILRPLSDMTEEEAKELDLVDVQIGLLAFGDRLKMHMTPEQFKKCLDKHFDLFNLIPEGLAISKPPRP